MIDIQPGVIFTFRVRFVELGSANEHAYIINIKVKDILESRARAYDHWQVEGASEKRGGAVITELLDDGTVEGEKETDLTSQSKTTALVAPQRLNVEDRKETFTNELQQTFASFQLAGCFSLIWLQTAHEKNCCRSVSTSVVVSNSTANSY